MCANYKWPIRLEAVPLPNAEGSRAGPKGTENKDDGQAAAAGTAGWTSLVLQWNQPRLTKLLDCFFQFRICLLKGTYLLLQCCDSPECRLKFCLALLHFSVDFLQATRGPGVSLRQGADRTRHANGYNRESGDNCCGNLDFHNSVQKLKTSNDSGQRTGAAYLQHASRR